MVGYNNEKELIEKRIAFKVKQQFPAIYRDEGSEMVQLVYDYYKFLETETNMSHYNSRRLYEYRDISTTLSTMIIYWQKAFLADLPLMEDTTVRLIVKNIMDLYRRKGTRGGIKLFFRMFYQEDAEVIYPSKYMFKPSDSSWKTGTYLQMYPNDNRFFAVDGTEYDYENLINKNIKGSISGAKAVVDKINFILMNKTIHPILYINNVKGQFTRFDDVVARMNGLDVSFGKIAGSLNNIDIDLAYGGTTENEIGAIYSVKSNYGLGGKIRVTETSPEQTGLIEYDLIDGGFGYTLANTKLLVSNQVVVFNNTDFIFKEFQDLQGVSSGAQATVIGQNFNVMGFRTENTLIPVSTNEILQTDPATVKQVNSVKLFPKGNAAYSTYEELLSSFQSAVAGVEPHRSRFLTIVPSTGKRLGDLNQNGSFGSGDYVYLQQYYEGTLTDESVKSYIETTFNDYMEANPGTYGSYVYRKSYYDLISELNDSSPGNLYPETGNISDVRVESLSEVQVVSLITDVIDDFVNVPINSANYNTVPPAVQPMSGTADPVTLATPLNEAFDLTPFEIGVIDNFMNINPGQDYVNDAFALVIDETMVPFARYEQIIIFSNLPAAFSVGDVIQQANSGIRGKITGVNGAGRYIKVTPYDYYGFNDYDPLLLRGNEYPILSAQRDYTSKRLGFNADMLCETIFKDGKITKVQVINSGYGYPDGELVYIVDENETIQARGTAISRSQGITEGYWGELNSHVNGYVAKTITKRNKQIKPTVYFVEETLKSVTGSTSDVPGFTNWLYEDSSDLYQYYDMNKDGNDSILDVLLFAAIAYGTADQDTLDRWNNIVAPSLKEQTFYEEYENILYTVDEELQYYDGQMKIQDSDYYQEYSYDIKSVVPEENYKEALHKNVHLAGTKQFSSFLYAQKTGSAVKAKFSQFIKNDYEPGGVDVVGPGQEVGGSGVIRADSDVYFADNTFLRGDVTN